MSLPKHFNTQMSVSERYIYSILNQSKGYDVMNETTARSMELTDTAELMASSDYKDRFKAEYGQVAIRCEKLKAMLEKWDRGELNFMPTCPRSLYELQVRAMEDYIAVLQARAVIEGVAL